MNNDIRISVDFFDHHKTAKLEKELGFQGVKSLLHLWFYAAKYRPDGHLKNMDLDDIINVSKWNGEPDIFLKALTHQDKSWLDWIDDHYYLHNWEKRNGYACQAEKRSNIAKKAAELRWNKKEKQYVNAQSIKKAMLQQCSSNAPAYAPNPNPNPNLNLNNNNISPLPLKRGCKKQEKKISRNKNHSSLAEDILKDYPKYETNRSIANGHICKLLTLPDDKIGKYPEFVAQTGDAKNIVQERVAILKKCVENYKIYCEIHHKDDEFMFKSYNFFGNAAHWREFIEDPRNIKDNLAKQADKKNNESKEQYFKYIQYLEKKIPLTSEEIWNEISLDKSVDQLIRFSTNSQEWENKYAVMIRQKKAEKEGLTFEKWSKNEND